MTILTFLAPLIKAASVIGVIWGILLVWWVIFMANTHHEVQEEKKEARRVYEETHFIPRFPDGAEIPVLAYGPDAYVHYISVDGAFFNEYGDIIQTAEVTAAKVKKLQDARQKEIDDSNHVRNETNRKIREYKESLNANR